MRLSSELLDVLSYRLNNNLNTFINYLKGSIEYNSFSLEIIGLKKEFIYAYKLGNLKIFPEEIRKKIVNIIQENADDFQKTLVEKTKMIDRSGVINSMIKNNPINVFK
jgi:hypothetical protein